MSDFKKIQEIARSSLLADFFAVRIEEEELFDKLQVMLAKIKLPTPLPALDKIKAIAVRSPDPTAFIDGVKQANLFTSMRDILTKIKVT